MIEARADTIMRGVEHIGGGLYPEEIAKRKKRVKKGGKVCKGEGCITRISAYNRDHRGHPETLCYKCRSRVGYPTREYKYDQEDARRRYVCENDHDIAEVGRKDNGVCRECDRERQNALYEEKMRAAGKTVVPPSTRIALNNLARLIEERGVSLNALGRKTGIPPATLRGYAKIGEEKGYKCPPHRAKIIANRFRVSVAVLAGEAELVEELSEVGEAS